MSLRPAPQTCAEVAYGCLVHGDSGSADARTTGGLLFDAAFGAQPGARALPAPKGGLDSWHRAVALGGQGHYGAARTQLRRARAATTHVGIHSLTLSTEGSLLRQLGWYRLAAAKDGAALAMLGPGAEHAATADAVTGLAADALGLARYRLAARLLDRAVVAAAAAGLRQQIRHQWVAAELALATGAWADALRRADAAVALAESASSVRHRVKSRLLRAAALTCHGEMDHAVAESEAVAAACVEHGLVPLRWAAAMLRAGIGGDAPAAQRAADEARACTGLIERRGGFFRQSRQALPDSLFGGWPLDDYCGSRSADGWKHTRSGFVPLVTPGNR